MALPLYELKINPEQQSFVDAIALVNEPAIESDFIAFAKHAEMHFAVNDERREILGGAMIPDMQIYRKDAKGEEYNVFFSRETIRQVAQTYFKKGFQSNLNLDHTTTPAKSFVFQSYLVDSKMGMPSPKGLNLPDGSWVVGVKVEDDAVWNDIKTGKRKGFSVEGMFQFFQAKKKSEQDEMEEALRDLNNQLDKLKAR